MDAPKLSLDGLQSVRQLGIGPPGRGGLALTLLGMENAMDLLQGAGTEVGGRQPRSIGDLSDLVNGGPADLELPEDCSAYPWGNDVKLQGLVLLHEPCFWPEKPCQRKGGNPASVGQERDTFPAFRLAYPFGTSQAARVNSAAPMKQVAPHGLQEKPRISGKSL